MTIEKQARGVNLPPPDQVCVVVRDIEKAIEHYQTVFGLGPFRVMEVSTKDMSYRCWTGTARQRSAFAQCGPIQIELIQPLEGDTPQAEFLREKGEGVHHLRFQVEDLEATLAALAELGISAVWRHKFVEAAVSYAYVNSDTIGGVVFELIEDKKGFTRQREAR